MQLWERFRPGQTPPASLGASRDYNVDMVPKFIMANGNLVKVREIIYCLVTLNGAVRGSWLESTWSAQLLAAGLPAERS